MFLTIAMTASSCIADRRRWQPDLSGERHRFPVHQQTEDGRKSGHRLAGKAMPVRGIEVRDRFPRPSTGRVELMDPAVERDLIPDRAADDAKPY
jgi:hypothetical protein